METVEISPVPGLIAAIPATRPSTAWTRWLGEWFSAEPDTRSPYWPVWNRFTARECLREAYAERPGDVGRAKTPGQFMLDQVAAQVHTFAKIHQERTGTSLGYVIPDLKAALAIKVLTKGLDLTRTNGEIAYFIKKYSQGWLSQELVYLSEIVHVTKYGMEKKDLRLARRGAMNYFTEAAPGLNPEGVLILKREISKLTDQALRGLLRRAKA